MVGANSKLTGARIFLRDPETGETLGNEIIRSFNPVQKTFTVFGKNLPDKIPQRINALIVTDNSMDYNICSLKSISDTNERIMEFGIIKTDEKKNERGAPRFKVSAPAVVRELTDFMGLKKTNNVFLVNLRDISASGIMFQAPVNQFDISDEVLLDTNKLRPGSSILAKVVRKQNKQGFNEEVACTIIKMMTK